MSSSDRRYFDTVGYVLRRRDFGEADRMITFYTKDFGKLVAKARSVRSGKSKLAGSLEPFSQIKLEFVNGRMLPTVIGARVAKLYDLSHLGLEFVSAGLISCEMLDVLCPEAVVSNSIFDLMGEYYQSLSEMTHPMVALHYFSYRLLRELGYMPELPIRSEQEHFFNLEKGSFTPTADEAMALAVSRQTIKLWKLMDLTDLVHVKRVAHITEIATTSQEVLEKYYQYKFDKPIVTKKLL